MPRSEIRCDMSYEGEMEGEMGRGEGIRRRLKISISIPVWNVDTPLTCRFQDKAEGWDFFLGGHGAGVWVLQQCCRMKSVFV